jgi:hypothetical protein
MSPNPNPFSVKCDVEKGGRPDAAAFPYKFSLRAFVLRTHR